MARLYIANCTAQNCVIYYRMTVKKDGTPDPQAQFRPLPLRQELRLGTQIVLGGDLHLEQIKVIVEQLERQGLVSVENLKTGKVQRRQRITWLYDIDKAVPATAIRDAAAHNSSVLIQAGAAFRQRAAIAAQSKVLNATPNAAGPTLGEVAPPTEFSVALEQEEDGTPSIGKRLDEGYFISEEGGAPPTDGSEAIGKRGKPPRHKAKAA